MSFKSLGYQLFKKAFDPKDLEILNYFNEYPHSNNDSNKFSDIEVNCEKIVKLANSLKGKKYKPFMKKIYHKEAFFGSHEAYHQDYYYRKNFDIESDEFLQCFIALENLSFCPINVFEGSHKLGLLDHDTVLERDGKAKFIVNKKELVNIKHLFKSIYLDKGDVLFFDYLLVHGSCSNHSPINQPRAIIQLCSKELKYIKHGSDRRIFEKNILKNLLNEKI